MRSLMKIFVIILITVMNNNIFAQCNSELLTKCVSCNIKNTIYLKDFKIRLKKAKKNQNPPMAKFIVVLNNNTRYRFNICNAKDFEGKGVIQLYDDTRLQGSSYDPATGKSYNGFDFVCNKTGVYSIVFHFKAGKEGCAVGLLSYVK